MVDDQHPRERRRARRVQAGRAETAGPTDGATAASDATGSVSDTATERARRMAARRERRTARGADGAATARTQVEGTEAAATATAAPRDSGASAEAAPASDEGVVPVDTVVRSGGEPGADDAVADLSARRQARRARRAARPGRGWDDYTSSGSDDGEAGRGSDAAPKRASQRASSGAGRDRTGSAEESITARTARGHQPGQSDTSARAAVDAGDASPAAVSVPVPVSGAPDPVKQVYDRLGPLADGMWNRVAAVRLPDPARLNPMRWQVPRLRLLPSIIFVAVLMVGVRVGDIWSDVSRDGVSGVSVQPAIAQQGADETDLPAAPPAPVAQSATPTGPTRLADIPAEPPAPSGESGAGDTRLAQAGAQTTAAVAPDEAARASAEALLSASERDEMTPTEERLIRDLSDRRAELQDRERTLDQREALLQVAERRIEEKAQELEQLRVRIEDLLGDLDERSEAQLQSLVGIYESMRPGNAAEIFNGLEMDVLISVLERMREQRSAPILANMQPERARQVTAELALRRQLPVLPDATDPMGTAQN